MRIGIQGWGSEGDIRPLVALAARLRRGGHDVRLVVTVVDGKDYGPICRSLDVPLRMVPERMNLSLREISRQADSADPLKASRKANELAFYPYLDEMYAAAVDLCSGSDVVVGHFASWYVRVAALQARVPFAAVHYVPGLVPTRDAPPPGFPQWRWLTGAGWWLVRALIDLGFRGPAAKFFARKGLPPVRHALTNLLLSDQLNLLAASPSFWPPASDWGDVHRVCGDFVMPEDVEPWEPSPALRAFLDAGARPVMFSLGSMEHLAPERARDLMVASARQAKVRAIIQTKSERHDEEGREGDLYFLPWAPHRRLLPLCSAMVHHGGAGTTHSALRAGLPAVVVPFIFEQRAWADRLLRAGTALKALSFWKATPEKLAVRIRETLASEPLRRRASELATAMAHEDGTGTATRLLERLAQTAR